MSSRPPRFVLEIPAILTVVIVGWIERCRSYTRRLRKTADQIQSIRSFQSGIFGRKRCVDGLCCVAENCYLLSLINILSGLY
ncbi:uncharacterized protein BO80DRAFT_17642 [Aspergillus ibericus CBS 121593]|uniref:Uncharacterized protein n=1 Tax=Aspergillus ibericus CBS 121593 TaxID=1448316 RepID=A0A395H8A3_9EURO|nr:hypothetical protein BO80DRAFT_17642 [Aspergillus ibericus CBS 121593]RAL03375.1 hypothetical protein BO80DRAFT_17642 [Aspergillus ibericus CBS 121593]